MYLWIKSFHLISVIIWFAGLFCVFGLFAVHADNRHRAEVKEACQGLELKLIRYLMNPAMILTYVFGVWMLVLNPAWLSQGWLHAKLIGVALVTGHHHWASITRKKFARDEIYLSGKACRRTQGIPLLLLAFIVLLVILKPLL